MLNVTNTFWNASRPLTRVWYDIIATLAFVAILTTSPLWLDVFVVVIVVLMIHIGHTFHNDLADRAVDSCSSETQKLNRELVKRSGSAGFDFRLVGYLSLAAGVLLLFFYEPDALMPAVLAVILGILYNFEPVRLSGRPYVTLIFWPIMWLLTYWGCAMVVNINPLGTALWYILFVCIFMGIGEGLAQDIRDWDNDLAGGRKTTVSVWGVSMSATVAGIAFCLAIIPLTIYGITQMNRLMLALAIMTCVFFLIKLWPKWKRLQQGFTKADAKFFHVGSITVLTAVNSIIIFDRWLLQIVE